MKPLFIPLKTEYYEKFESGEKTDELCKYGSRWNEKTCPKGRRAVLSKGYGTKNRMTGCISRFKKQHGSLFGSTYRPDILKVYGTLEVDIACISFENLTPQQIEKVKYEVLIEHTEHGRKEV